MPEDLSIVGLDDTPMAARIPPPLTTVRLPIRDMAREAAMGLLRVVGEVDNTPNNSFTPEIIIRRSTSYPV